MNEHLQRAEPKPLFDPLSPEFIRDPYPFYERLRMTDPMHLTPLGAYVASRHADVSLILRDKRFGKNFVERMTRRYGPQVMQEPVYRCMRHWMLQQDPPDHTRLRGLVVKAFTARRVEDMRPRIQQIVNQSLDRVAARGHMDLIEDFAFRLPVTVICDMLGIPEDHREAFTRVRALADASSTRCRCHQPKSKRPIPATPLHSFIFSSSLNCGGVARETT